MRELTLISDVPESVVITSGEELQKTQELNITLQQSIRIVEAMYKEPKAAAHAAHKAITAKESELLTPLKQYKAKNDRAISNYLIALERKEEEEAKAREEAKKEYLEEVSVDESPFAELANINPKPPTAEVALENGISAIDDYEIEIIDPMLVPIVVDGVMVRTIDMSAIKKIVKKNSGELTIPGIRVIKKKSIRTRVL